MQSNYVRKTREINGGHCESSKLAKVMITQSVLKSEGRRNFMK